MHNIFNVISYGNNFPEQTGHEQPCDDDHLSNDEQPCDEEPTSFINLADSTSGSSDVILTHTSNIEEDVTKIFWDRLAGICINLELFNIKHLTTQKVKPF